MSDENLRVVGAILPSGTISAFIGHCAGNRIQAANSDRTALRIHIRGGVSSSCFGLCGRVQAIPAPAPVPRSTNLPGYVSNKYSNMIYNKTSVFRL